MITMLVVEYREANALINNNRALMRDTVVKTIASNFIQKLKGYAINKADIDLNWQSLPLNFLAIEQGRWVFPYRFSGELQATPSDLWQVYVSAKRDSDSDETKASLRPETEQRIRALTRIQTALLKNDDVALKNATNEYFLSFENFRLSVTEELVSGLTFLQLEDRSRWNKQLIELVVFQGTERFLPLVDYIFRQNDRLTRVDTERAINQLKIVLENANIDMAWFNQSVAELWRENPDVDLTTLDELYIIDKQWISLKSSDEITLMLPFALDVELQVAQAALIQQGILNQADRLIAQSNGLFSHKLALVDLPFTIERAQWQLQTERQTRFFIGKIILAVIFMLSLFGLTAFFAYRNQKKMEFIALRENFVNLVSHELKTPLAAIRIMVETLQKRNERGLDIKNYPEKVVREVDRLWLMVDNLLSLNQIKSGELELNMSKVNLHSLIERVNDKFKENPSTPLVFENKLPLDGRYFLDPLLFELVFINLFSNAIKYCEHAEVRLSVSIDATRNAILVSDNACGIAPENWTRIFDDFYRESNSKAKPGTGIGLSLCRQIAALHNLKISVKESSQSGTTWMISLPIAVPGDQ